MASPLPEPSSPHVAVYDLCERVAQALNRALPRGFRGKLEITIDGLGVLPHHVAVNLRPPQPRKDF